MSDLGRQKMHTILSLDAFGRLPKAIFFGAPPMVGDGATHGGTGAPHGSLVCNPWGHGRPPWFFSVQPMQPYPSDITKIAHAYHICCAHYNIITICIIITIFITIITIFIIITILITIITFIVLLPTQSESSIVFYGLTKRIIQT